MTTFSLVLFDDAVASRWAPFSLTRPAGELLFGALTLRARAERVFGARCHAQLAAEHLVGFEEGDAPPVSALDDAPAEGNRLFWLSRAVPAWGVGEQAISSLTAAGPVMIEDDVVGWYAPAGSPPPSPRFLRELPSPEARGEPPVRIPGRVLGRVWELIHGNPDQIALDVAALNPAPSRPELAAGVLHWGEHPLILGEGVRCEPGCALDTSEGPIWLEDRVVVRAFTRLCGPAYIGPDSTVAGGFVSHVSCGPVCRVHGELTDSVCLGYTNKQHDGHMGHAYLGRWVNIGAGTNNSDLKNNYSTVRLWTPDRVVDTGEMKIGCLLGDHVKTGIGLLLNTGTVVGAGSNLYGAAMPPKHVPPFSWGTGEELMPFRLDKFLEVAERAMARRGVALGEAERVRFGRVWQEGRREAEPESEPKG